MTPTGALLRISRASASPHSCRLNRTPLRCANQFRWIGNSRSPPTPNSDAPASRDKDAEAEVHQTLPRHSRAAIPWWREDGAHADPEEIAELLPPRLDVVALLGVCPSGAKLALASFCLMIDVGQPVLMDSDTFSCGADPLLEPSREAGRHGLRDGGKIDGKVVGGKEIEQFEEAVVAPAGVIIPEEELSGAL